MVRSPTPGFRSSLSLNVRSGFQIDMPPVGDPEIGATFKRAAKAEIPKENHPSLIYEEGNDAMVIATISLWCTKLMKDLGQCVWT